MDINSLYKGITPEVGTGRHPEGVYPAIVRNVSMKQTRDGKKRYVSFEFATEHGVPPEFNVWLVSEEAAIKAQSDVAFRANLVKSIQINKGILVKLGVASEQEVAGYDLNQMLRGYASVKGKRVEISVCKDTKNPEYLRTIIYSLLPASQPMAQPEPQGFGQPRPQAFPNQGANQLAGYRQPQAQPPQFAPEPAGFLPTNPIAGMYQGQQNEAEIIQSGIAMAQQNGLSMDDIPF